jgi:hypothetical protein
MHATASWLQALQAALGFWFWRLSQRLYRTNTVMKFVSEDECQGEIHVDGS